jgi:hypothetical protein
MAREGEVFGQRLPLARSRRSVPRIRRRRAPDFSKIQG